MTGVLSRTKRGDATARYSQFHISGFFRQVSVSSLSVSDVTSIKEKEKKHVHDRCFLSIFGVSLGKQRHATSHSLCQGELENRQPQERGKLELSNGESSASARGESRIQHADNGSAHSARRRGKKAEFSLEPRQFLRCSSPPLLA